jgi:hypothetical protein
MSDKIRIAKTAMNLATIVANLAKAGEKFREGNRDEGLRNVGNALQTTYKNVEDFRYSYGELRKLVKNLFGYEHRAEINAAQNRSTQENGYFTGQWYSRTYDLTLLIYHYKDTNAISLYFPRSSSGYNEYIGGIDLENGVLVWTGRNSRNQEYVIVGTPDNQGHNMSCDTWAVDGNNEIESAESFKLSRV